MLETLSKIIIKHTLNELYAFLLFIFYELTHLIKYLSFDITQTQPIEHDYGYELSTLILWSCI